MEYLHIIKISPFIGGIANNTQDAERAGVVNKFITAMRTNCRLTRPAIVS